MTQIGKIIDGRFKVLQLIGTGGTSRVYLAEDIRLKKKWAVKEIPKYVNGKKNLLFIESAIKEAKIIKSLDHPSIVRIIDIFEDRKYVYIVEDYITGRSLKKTVAEQGTVSERQLVRWAVKICDVLAYLHSRKNPVIYRDLKPENIILTADGYIRLVDFGTARTFKEGQKSDTCYLGTRRYAAPEQFEEGDAQTDMRTDIYGLGSTLKHLSEYCPDMSGRFETIISRAVEPDPEDRFQTAMEMKQALKALSSENDEVIKRPDVSLFRILLALAVVICTFLAAGTLAIRAGGRSAPVSLSSMIREFGSDEVFSLEEEEELLKTIMPRLSEIKEQEGFEETAFEIGQLYWFYYEYGSDNMAGMIAAVPWFGLAREYSEMAAAFEFIGKFHQDIDRMASEDEEGIYGTYFAELKILEQRISGEDVPDTVKLDIYRLVINSVRTYAREFRNDGISRTDQEKLIGNAAKNAAAVSNEGLPGADAAYEAVAAAYPD